MNSILNGQNFFVREHVGMFKAANNYDILDPETQEITMTCREDNLGFFTKMFRFTKYKRMTPFCVDIKTASGDKVLRVQKSTSFFTSLVEVFDENDALVGKFKQKMFSIGGKFDVFKKFDGIAKELFTTADNYMLTIEETVPKDNNMRVLIMGAVICIDMVLRE